MVCGRKATDDALTTLRFLPNAATPHPEPSIGVCTHAIPTPTWSVVVPWRVGIGFGARRRRRGARQRIARRGAAPAFHHAAGLSLYTHRVRQCA